MYLLLAWVVVCVYQATKAWARRGNEIVDIETVFVVSSTLMLAVGISSSLFTVSVTLRTLSLSLAPSLSLSLLLSLSLSSLSSLSLSLSLSLSVAGCKTAAVLIVPVHRESGSMTLQRSVFLMCYV